MAFTFTINRQTNDELDVTVTALDTDAAGTFTYPALFQVGKSAGDVPMVTMTPLGSGFFTGSWFVSALSRTALTITKGVVGGSASGGVRLFLKAPR